MSAWCFAQERHSIALTAARAEAEVASEAVSQSAVLERDRARLLSEQMAEAQAAVSAAHAAHAQLQQEAATTAMEASQVRISIPAPLALREAGHEAILLRTDLQCELWLCNLLELEPLVFQNVIASV